ncbi:MAG TPA: TonB-dependent receptor, partial [Gemmatimonadales bacterium]|nr:TonB-dependent receptor [Gemmatimonadales bacterium]
LGTVYFDAAPARGWTSRLTIGGQRQFTAGSGAFFGDPFRFTLTAHRTVADWQHTVALGSRARALAGGSGEWTSVWSDGSRMRERLFAGFGQLEVSLIHAVTLTAGFRHDDYDTFGGATTWRVTGAWLPHGATKVRASYGTGFMPPSLAARYGGPFQNPNPDIRPERSRGYDVGIERFVLSGRGSLGLTWFRTELRDLIGFQSAPFPGLGMSVNVDRARTTGLEAAGRLTSDRADLRLAWTWLSARSESAPSPDLARLIRRPRHTVSADLLYRAGSRLSAGAGLVIVAGREDADFNAFPSERVDPGNYEVGRLHGSYELFRDFILRVRVENVLDRRYEEVYGFPALGRSIQAGASVGF